MSRARIGHKRILLELIGDACSEVDDGLATQGIDGGDSTGVALKQVTGCNQRLFRITALGAPVDHEKSENAGRATRSYSLRAETGSAVTLLVETIELS